MFSYTILHNKSFMVIRSYIFKIDENFGAHEFSRPRPHTMTRPNGYLKVRYLEMIFAQYQSH